MDKQLTIEQAKNEGYKYAVDESGEGLIALDKCTESDLYYLASKESKPFTIGDKTVAELVDDYLCNQDEVADEDGHLNELASEVDYSDITKKLNEAFAKTKYFMPTSIRLITTLKPQSNG